MEDIPMMSDGTGLNISDVLDVLQQNLAADEEMRPLGPGMAAPPPVQQPAAAAAPMETRSRSQSQSLPAGKAKPYLEIVEQPASKALRFRYECEGRSAGSIPGVNYTPDNKTFPTIRIVGYKGRAIVVVSCVTKDPPYRPHPHNLVGKDVCKNGVCRVQITSDNMTYVFDKLGIQCVKRKEIETHLLKRQAEQVDPYNTGFDHRKTPTSIDLNAVRLCFQGFLDSRQKGRYHALDPVVSEPIYDKKAMSDLTICKLSHCTASVAGGMEMVLLCEKVTKEDIEVRFFEVSKETGQEVWEAKAEFQPVNVHKQVAIAFRTPSYKNTHVEKPVDVFVQLRRPSDGVTSEPLDFQLLPIGLGRSSQLWSLRKAFARKKAAALERVNPCPERLPARPRYFHEFNVNGDSLDELLNARRAYGKLSALRALNDIYNVPRASVDCTSQLSTRVEPSIQLSGVDLENNNDVVDDASTIVPGKNGVEAEAKVGCFDYVEVGKWVEKSQEAGRPEDVAEPLLLGAEKCLDELLDEVGELDKIYEDTQVKLAQSNGHAETTTDVPDNRTYTSLQMAMKNPVWVISRAVARPPLAEEEAATPPPRPPPPASRIKRDGLVEEPLPPLPPKRIRKTPSMPVLPRAASSQGLEQPPRKGLPSPPAGGTLPKQSRGGLFSKLFSKKPKKESREMAMATSTTSLPGLGKESQKSQELAGDVTPPYGVDLTEAEHYALYTAMAPRATASEFDEMSFYYSPVEGGKILVEGKETG